MWNWFRLINPPHFIILSIGQRFSHNVPSGKKFQKDEEAIWSHSKLLTPFRLSSITMIWTGANKTPVLKLHIKIIICFLSDNFISSPREYAYNFRISNYLKSLFCCINLEISLWLRRFNLRWVPGFLVGCISRTRSVSTALYEQILCSMSFRVWSLKWAELSLCLVWAGFVFNYRTFIFLFKAKWA